MEGLTGESGTGINSSPAFDIGPRLFLDPSERRHRPAINDRPVHTGIVDRLAAPLRLTNSERSEPRPFASSASPRSHATTGLPHRPFPRRRSGAGSDFRTAPSRVALPNPAGQDYQQPLALGHI